MFGITKDIWGFYKLILLRRKEQIRTFSTAPIQIMFINKKYPSYLARHVISKEKLNLIE